METPDILIEEREEESDSKLLSHKYNQEYFSDSKDSLYESDLP